MQVPGYPNYLEAWWKSYAQGIFGGVDLREREAQIRARVQRLTDLFTLERNGIAPAEYDDPELIAAYGIFYFPEMFVRAQFPLIELLQRGWMPRASASILDLGSGTGAAGISAALVLQSIVKRIDVTAMDRSASALEISRLIAQHCGPFLPELRWKTERHDITDLAGVSDGFRDLIILSFSLNEPARHMDFRSVADYVAGLTNRLTDNGLLLLIEPALKETSERLERIRDAIVGMKDCYVWAPCLHQAACPLLATSKFWCHEVRPWNAPESLRLLNRHLHRTESVLKFSFLALGRRPPGANITDSFRLLSPWIKTKGKWIASGCASNGRRYEYQILKRTLSKKEIAKRIKESERGDIIMPDQKVRRLES